MKEAWSRVGAAADAVRARRLTELFAEDPGRVERFTVEACGLTLDLSKNRLDEPALEALLDLAAAAGLESAIERMLGGDPVNVTEGRAALHAALRQPAAPPFPGVVNDVMPAVHAVLGRVGELAGRVRSGQWRGYTGATITDVVNLGIGGSDLGPRMVVNALRDHADPLLEAHFVSNLDHAHLARTLDGLDPARTLFIIASKSFGTPETLTNARSARAWLTGHLGHEDAVARHFIAASSELERVRAFGIDAENMFEFWDWVGGRFSLWSAVGAAISVSLGHEVFLRLLAGAREMDRHFRQAAWRDNLPVLLGLVHLWYRQAFGAQSRAVLVYDYALGDLPAHLQQLEMESLGKRVGVGGGSVTVDTCPVVWGGLGNNGQHAYYQLLHQGTVMVPSDFIVPAESQRHHPAHDRAVAANALAQMEALMRGRTLDEARAELAASAAPDALERLAPHRVMPGNQPSTAIVYRRLGPEILGALVALYEHKVYVQGQCWGVNPFDQFGVELGKRLAADLETSLETGDCLEHDASTQALVHRLRGWQGPAA